MTLCACFFPRLLLSTLLLSIHHLDLSAFGEHVTLVVGYGGYVSSRAYVHSIQDNNTDAMARILRK